MGSLEGKETEFAQNELPEYAQIEDIKKYVPGGFHPIHLGDCIGSEDRFEVQHKLGYNDTCTVWLCFDHKNSRRVGIKVLQAAESSTSFPELVALHLFECYDSQELRSNHIFPIEEHFWIEGPNGRHLCLVVEVLGPAISYWLKGIGFDTPNLLTDLCFQASQGLKYLHDRKIGHGDFHPDHMRLQLDTDAMSNCRIYDLFGEPKVWHLKVRQEHESSASQPHYLVEPANIYKLEAKYRTGKIAIDSLSSAYRLGDQIKPHVFDTHYTPPEVRFLEKPRDFSSDIWSLASTIHLLRTGKLLLASLSSSSSLVSWLAWAYGPFPQESWNAIGKQLAEDSAVPVFTANTIPQRPKALSQGQPGNKRKEKAEDYPKEWAANRKAVVSLILGVEDTPRAIWQREMLQMEKDRSKYLRIKLPKDWGVWAKFQEERRELTGFRSLLHEDLGKERQWYEETDPLSGEAGNIMEILPGSIDDATLRRLDGTWILEVAPETLAEQALESQGSDADAPTKTDQPMTSHGKRLLIEQDQEAQPHPKKPRKFTPEHNLRDRIERVEQADDMTRFSYCLQSAEVDVLADLLSKMLKPDPKDRISVDEVVRHKWFEGSRTRFENAS
ncbi:kinase-like domain-containing protein [Xylariaceae sp. FL1651]|nr:kinase-like domain-containing protein [Xylariaceae sp. FL1651]